MGGPTLILLDTHVLLWLTEGETRLGAKARRIADAALAEDQLAVCAISFWEIAVLEQKGWLLLHQSIESWRRDLLELGLVEVAVGGDMAIAAAQLADFHPDPADRLITATASLRGATLVTADERILRWPGAVRRHDARV